MDRYNKRVNNKAFTIIELIVVIAIIGILVLFATPKFLGYVQKARLARIQHDVKVMETIMEDELARNLNVNYNNFEDNIKNLYQVIETNKLFEKEGHAKNLEYVAMRGEINGFSKLIAENEDNNFDEEFGMGGPVVILDSEEEEFKELYQRYKVIPDIYKTKAGTKLKGTFYANEKSKVYYEPDKPIKPVDKKDEAAAISCSASIPLPDYNFEHLTGTIVKYNGNAQHLIIPAYFFVEGKCWPVKIIGKGAFMHGDYKTIVIPDTVVSIEDDAFKDLELENAKIPGSVESIGPGAFDGNYEIQYGRSPSSPSFNGGTGGSYTHTTPDGESKTIIHKAPSASEVGVIFNPSSGTIIKGSSGSSGSSGTGSGGSLYIPSHIEHNGIEYPVKEIAKGAYQGLGLITVQLPYTLERIEAYAFSGNQLIGITIPNSVLFIGEYAFAFNEVHKVGNILGPESIATIKTIIMKDKEQFSKVDKYGDILENEVKVDNFISPSSEKGPNIELKEHIWVTSIGNIVIDEDSELVTPSNKTELTNKIQEAKDLQKDDYVEGWDKLLQAIQKAEIINNKSNATNAEVINSIQSINIAIGNLSKPANKTALVSKIQEAKNLSQDDYIDGWDRLLKAIKDAEIINAKVDAKPIEVTNSINSINLAINQLLKSSPVDPDDEPPIINNQLPPFENGELNRYVTIEGYIPVSSLEDLMAISSESIHTFGSGTEWQRTVTGGLINDYIQVKNIDLSSIDNWEPIGNYKDSFYGEYNGGNFTISNLKINRPTEENVGLFSVLKKDSKTKGKISNVGLINVNVKGGTRTGALLGRSVSSEVIYSYSTGSVQGFDVNTGGLVGSGGYIRNSYSNSDVKGTRQVGGLAGTSTLIENSYATGNVTASETNAGGLAGWLNQDNKILNSYATGDVTAKTYAGGILGKAQEYNTRITNVYATGNVTADNYVGGLIGALGAKGALRYGYSTGRVISDGRNSGAQVGFLANQTYYAASVNDTYFNQDLSGKFYGVGYRGITGSGTGSAGPVQTNVLTEVELMKQSSYTKFDFINVWTIEEGIGYPTFQWQNK